MQSSQESWLKISLTSVMPVSIIINPCQQMDSDFISAALVITGCKIVTVLTKRTVEFPSFLCEKYGGVTTLQISETEGDE